MIIFAAVSVEPEAQLLPGVFEGRGENTRDRESFLSPGPPHSGLLVWPLFSLFLLLAFASPPHVSLRALSKQIGVLSSCLEEKPLKSNLTSPAPDRLAGTRTELAAPRPVHPDCPSLLQQHDSAHSLLPGLGQGSFFRSALLVPL